MQENEISLKELILILLKGWKWIIGTTLACLIMSVLILSLFNTKTYEVNLKGTIVKSDVYETLFGAYPAHTIKNIDLINQVKSEEFNDYIKNIDNLISINTSLTDTGEFTISLNSNENTNLKNVKDRILDSFESYMNFNLQEKSIKYFTDIYQVTLDRTKVTVENNIKLIESLTQKLTTIDRLIATDVINPEYDVFSSQRASVEYDTIRQQYEIERLTNSLVLLDNYSTNSFDAYLKQENPINGIEVAVNFNSTNSIQELRRFNPLTLLAISVILGGMLGVFIVFFLHYWKNN